MLDVGEEIRAIGNKLRHEYDRLESSILWNTAAQFVPELKPIIEEMIASLERDEKDTAT